MTGRSSDGEKLLTPAEVAALFRVDPKTVTRWAKAGKLTSIRTLGGHRRYRASEVYSLLGQFPPAPGQRPQPTAAATGAPQQRPAAPPPQRQPGMRPAGQPAVQGRPGVAQRPGVPRTISLPGSGMRTPPPR